MATTIVTIDGVSHEIDVDELLKTGLFTDVLHCQQQYIDTVAQEAEAPDDLPKTRSEGALSEEDAKYSEFYRKVQNDLLTRDHQAELEQANMEDAIARATELLASTHQHEFTYCLNQNHTALRGCKCGLSFATLLAGPDPDGLVWHQIHEVEE